MRLIWYVFGFVVVLQKALIPFYFFVLAAFTAPADTSALVKELNRIVKGLQGNLALDLTLLTVGALGLMASSGWGNWRMALHRRLSKPRLTRLASDARRVAEDIAATVSQEQAQRQQEMSLPFDENRSRLFSQDFRHLSKHMMEAHSVIERLKDVNYWHPQDNYHHEIGIAGATSFAAESTCKALYAASEKIRADLQDGFVALVTQSPITPRK